MSESEFIHSDITGKVIGCAFRDNSFLGNGFQEVIYQRALAYELGSSGISYEREKEQPIYYRERQ